MYRMTSLALLTLACRTPEDTLPDEDTDTGSVQGEVGQLTGWVCAPNQISAVPAAFVEVQVGDAILTARTDTDGKYVLDDVPVGEAIVRAWKGSYSGSTSAPISSATMAEAEGPCLDEDIPAIAVVSGEYDDIGAILTELGIPYDSYDGLSIDGRDLLTDPSALGEYDIVFLNCGLSYDYMSEDDFTTIAANLEDFADDGGSLYASDWAYYLVERTWPDLVEFMGDGTMWAPALGVASTYAMDVEDEDVAIVLGAETTDITYDLDVWVVALGYGGDGEPLLSGEYSYWINDYQDTSVAEGPAAVLLPGDGPVLWTSFHNETQVSADVGALLQHFVFSM
jgi:hypothetical protein